LNLAVVERVFEGRHAFAAVGDLCEESLVRVGEGRALAQGGDYQRAELLALAARAVADRAVSLEGDARRVAARGRGRLARSRVAADGRREREARGGRR
jgi:hypothetical protein